MEMIYFTKTATGGVRMTAAVKEVVHTTFHRKSNVNFRNNERDLLMLIKDAQDLLKAQRAEYNRLEAAIKQTKADLTALIEEAAVSIIGHGTRFVKPNSGSYNEAFTVQEKGEAKAFVYIETPESFRANAAKYCAAMGITNDWLVANGFCDPIDPKVDIHEANKSDMDGIYQATAQELVVKGVLVEKPSKK